MNSQQAYEKAKRRVGEGLAAHSCAHFVMVLAWARMPVTNQLLAQGIQYCFSDPKHKQTMQHSSVCRCGTCCCSAWQFIPGDKNMFRSPPPTSAHGKNPSAQRARMGKGSSNNNLRHSPREQCLKKQAPFPIPAPVQVTDENGFFIYIKTSLSHSGRRERPGEKTSKQIRKPHQTKVPM